MARLYISGDTLLAGYAPVYDVELKTLIWAGSHFRLSGARVASVDMFASSELLQGPQARDLLVEGVASLLRRGRVLAHVVVRRPSEIGFFCLSDAGRLG